ncbi:MAG: SMC family ATPase [Fibromonadales bacterium]|nr:SMC family ATPase [Fibromonadales bacterium]
MKINKVELKNYRIHEEYEQSFENGINLLLGNNGCGKSSILEAIGFALFNTSTRSDKLEEIISKGKENGSVKVSFTGNDGKEYEIERKLKGSQAVLTDLNSMQKTKGGIIEIYNQIGKILDIENLDGKSRNNVFFDSVICAKQNHFIDIFTQEEGKRKPHFDKLFDTAIYDILHKKLGEQNEKKYEEEGNVKNAVRKSLADKQKNIEELENNLKKQNNELTAEAENLTKLENELKREKQKLTEYNKMKEQINAKEKDLNNSAEKIKHFTEARDKDKDNLLKSEQAKKFLENNNEDFKKYESAKKQSEAREAELNKFGNADKIHEDLKNQQQKLKDELIKLEEGDKKNEINNMENFTAQISEKENELHKEQEDFDKINSDKKTKETELKNTQAQQDVLQPISENLEKLSNSKAENFREEERLKAELVTLKEKVISNDLLAKEEEEINKDKKLREELLGKLKIEDARIFELEAAQQDLSGGKCPILKESCPKVTTGNEDYFANRFKELHKNKKDLEKKLEDFAQLSDKEKKINEKKMISNDSCKQIEKNENSLKICEANSGKHKAEEEVQIAKSKCASVEEIKNSLKAAQNLSIEQKNEMKNYDKQIDKCNEKLTKIKKDIQTLIKNKEACLNKLKNIEETINKHGISLRELEPKIAEAQQNKNYASKLQSEINQIKNETLNPLEKVYKEYLQNEKIAKEYETLKKHLEDSEKNIHNETEKKEKFGKELEVLKSGFSEEQLKLQDKAVESLTETNKSVIEKVTGLKKEIEYKNKEIEEYRSIEIEIKKIDSEIAIIQRKLALTSIFKKKVKDLGSAVAEERVKRIADYASRYFNKITNRPESILWVCLEKDKYSLYLDNGQHQCSFINLSGGEQISVAIAIRLALSLEFGNSGFIILDEPTNNLDRDKRQLLAENLPKMVENLTQLFVVTHDDTFRNSATKVIDF